MAGSRPRARRPGAGSAPEPLERVPPRAGHPRVSAPPATRARGGRPRIGVLGLQGDFAKHAAALEALGCEPVRVSLPEHLEPEPAALVLPGGESSTMLRLLAQTGLREPVERFVRTRPVLATCAGLILLAREADRLPAPTFGVLDVTASRNAWGRQVHSFEAEVQAPALGGTLTGVFIRAPRVTRVGPGVEVVARLGDEVVGVRQGLAVGLAFHPELTDDRRAHAWFLAEVAGVPGVGAAGARA